MPKIVVDTEEVFDPHEAAQKIGIGYATLYRWIKNKKIIPLKASGRTYITQSEIDRLKSELQKDPKIANE